METNPLLLRNQVALVTGASHGIGRVIANVLARNGAEVIITDIQKISGENVARIIRKTGMKAEFVYADLRKENDIKKLIDLTIEKFGGLDIIVNNARPKFSFFTFDDSFKEFDLGMDILLKAPALIIKYALPHLVKSKNANIINISSTNALFVSHQPLVYHVAKAGLLQLTRYAAFHFGQYSIRVNAVCPGLVDLEDVKKPLSSNEENMEVIKLTVPLDRTANAVEIANVVLFLCTDSASYITGQAINIDGGITLGEQFHIARRAFLHKKK